MFAEMHYNNKDMMLLGLIIFMCYRGLCLCEKKTWTNVVLFSLSAALATNIKIIGVYYLGIIGLYVLFDAIIKKEFTLNLITKIIVFALLFIFGYVLLTPAMWTSGNNPISFCKYLYENARSFSRWDNWLLFEGRLWNQSIEPLTRRYLIKMIIFTIPPIILLLAVIGGLSVAVRLFKSMISKESKITIYERYIIFFSFLGIIPLVYALYARATVYNGWRHFYFIYSIIILLVLEALICIEEIIKNNLVKILAASLVVGYLAIGILINYPNEFAYYNILAGKNVENNYELDYWGVSFKQCYEIIKKDAKGKENVSVGVLENMTKIIRDRNYIVLSPKDKKLLSLTEYASSEADYIVVNQVYNTLYRQDSYEYIKNEYELLDTITSYGNVMYEIYKRP